jgi:predicted DNA-binding transcriptional regulator AlpA
VKTQKPRPPKNPNPIPPAKSSKHFAPPAQDSGTEHPLTVSDHPPGSVRLIDRGQLLRMIPVAYPTIWKWMVDGNFPRAVNCGGKNAWLESEVLNWIRSRPVTLLKGDAPDSEVQERAGGER